MPKPHQSPRVPTTRKAILTATAILALVIAAVGITAGWPGESEISAHEANGNGFLSPRNNEEAASLQQRVQQLESSVEQSLKIQGQLLELVNELNSKINPAGDSGQTRHASISETPPAHQYRQRHSNRAVDRFQRQREHQIRTLTQAGFSPERAAYIVDRQEWVHYEQMQLSYEYRFLKDKSSKAARALQEKIHTYSNPRRVLEQELSSEEFDQYLKAYGGRTEFQIGDLLESAPAYQAGLRPGDKIIRYNKQRVFHMGDLRSQVYQVAPGENVAVEIQRDGSSSTETIYIPAGPLGIRG